jgi:hypothetical protein
MRYLIAIILFCLVNLTEAKCITNDSWTGSDKNAHFVIGGLAGFIGSVQTESVGYGILAAGAVAGGKELIDLKMGTCSLQDFTVTLAGGVLGAYTGGWYVSYNNEKVIVGFNKRW